MIRYRFQTLSVSAALLCIAAAPAIAQRYTARQDGDVVTLTDATAKMNVAVVASLGKAWQIQVKGQNLVRTSPSLESFMANSGLNGMPLLAPFANRLDETAFYANGKKYNFDLEMGNVRGPIPSTGYVNGSKDWKLVEEIGGDARTHMRAEGICAFASYRGEENGRYLYSIGNLSPYGGFDLLLLYQKLNEVEDLQGNDVWGGSDNCGGSPRERGSSLCPQDLAKLIEDCQRNLAWPARSRLGLLK